MRALRPGAWIRTTGWWRALTTRVRIRILVAGVALLGLVLRDFLLVAAATFTLLLAESVTLRDLKARPAP